MFFQRGNCLNRQLGKPRIVYDPFFVVAVGGGGPECCTEGVTEKDVRSGMMRVINESLL